MHVAACCVYSPTNCNTQGGAGGSGTREWGGCLVRRLVPVYTSVVVWSSLVWYGTRAGTRSRPTQCYHLVKLVFAATQVAPPPVVLGAAPHQHLSQHTCTDCFFLLYTTPVVTRSLHSNSLCLFTSPSLSRLGLCHTGIAYQPQVRDGKRLCMSPLALQPLHSVTASAAAQGHTGVEEGPSMWSVLPPQPVLDCFVPC